jgi:hypothetical protein
MGFMTAFSMVDLQPDLLQVATRLSALNLGSLGVSHISMSIDIELMVEVGIWSKS